MLKMLPAIFTPDALPLTPYVKVEYRRVVAESLLAQFLHQFDGDERDIVFTGMLLHTLLDHGT